MFFRNNPKVSLLTLICYLLTKLVALRLKILKKSNLKI